MIKIQHIVVMVLAQVQYIVVDAIVKADSRMKIEILNYLVKIQTNVMIMIVEKGFVRIV